MKNEITGMKLRLIVMNFLQFAVWGAYLTSMGTYLFNIGCSVGCGGIYIFPDMIIVYKNKAAVMGRIKTRQIDALNYKKASI